MAELNKKFSLPRDEHFLKDTMRIFEKCEIIDSRISEEKDGPKIEEVYKCPCGNITLDQKSIIKDTDHPETGVEIIHMKSRECSL